MKACRYSKQYKADFPPKCGCQVCKRKWRRKLSHKAENGLQRHHLWWPKCDYKTGLEREFREATSVLIPAWLHTLIHRYHRPPEKPDLKEMEQAVYDADNGEHYG